MEKDKIIPEFDEEEFERIMRDSEERKRLQKEGARYNAKGIVRMGIRDSIKSSYEILTRGYGLSSNEAIDIITTVCTDFAQSFID